MACTAPALGLTTLPSWIAADRFVAPSLGRKRPTCRCTAAGSVVAELFGPGAQRYRAAQPDSLPYPATARAFFLGLVLPGYFPLVVWPLNPQCTLAPLQHRQ